MVQTEMLNDGTLIKHYSDAGFTLKQIETGIEYGEAIDIYPCPFTYEETENKIEVEKPAEESQTEEKKDNE